MDSQIIQQLADKAYQEAKAGNMNFWTMPDDDLEVKYWKEVWTKGYNACFVNKAVHRLSEALIVAEQMIIGYERKYPDTKQLLNGYTNDQAKSKIRKALSND